MMLLQPDDGLECLADCTVHSVVYLASAQWWSARVAPLDNSALWGNGALRGDLRGGTDYVMLSTEVWKQLLRIYGGGPGLPVPVLEGRPDLALLPFLVDITLSDPAERRSFLLSSQHSLAQAKIYICSLLDEDPDLCSLSPMDSVEPETPLIALYPYQLRLSRSELDDTLSTPRTRSTGKSHAGASSPVLRGWAEDEKLPEVGRPRPVRSDKAVVQERVLTALLLPRLSLRLKPLEAIVRDLALLDKDPCVEYEENK